MSLICKIKKNFGSFILDVNFENKEGTRCLLGASGAGKSLTLKCIAGIIKPDEGYIELNGKVLFDSEKRINLSPQKRHIGYMFQNYALFPNMNVYTNIMTGLISNKELSREQKKERVNEVIKQFHLDGLEKHRINQISGGEAQRVALARIIVSNPELIILDEPFSALDEYLRTKLQIDLKLFLEQYDKDVLLVTHNRDEAYLLSSNITVIKNGHSIISKTTRDLFDNPELLTASILIGCKNNARCELKNDKTLFVPEWGIEFKFKNELSSDIEYVGLKAHYFVNSKQGYKVKDIELIEQPFDKIVRFRFIDQKEDSPKLVWILPKEENIEVGSIKNIGFNLDKVLFLKEE